MSAIAINTRVATRCSVPPGTPLLERVCSYCKRTLGWVVCDPESDGERSHGACDPCASREHKRMSEAARYLRHEYTFEIGTPVSETIPAVSGADEAGPTRRGSVLPGSTETAPGEQVTFETRKEEKKL